MAQTLYRKYRPQTFDQVVGQNHVKVALQNQIEAGNVAHAFLFTGTRGIGKTTMARLLAKAVNCGEGKKVKPELAAACEAITQGRAIDVIEIDAASNRGIDEIRELREKVKYAPSVLPYKVYIIDEVHMLTTEAFNALLKTLEEPPAHAIFILATTEVHKVPATIISRCQRFDFKRVNSQDLLKRLNWLAEQEGKQVDEQVLKNILNQAEGSVRDAESLLGKIFGLGHKKITQKEAELVLPQSDWPQVASFVTALIDSNAQAALTLVNQLVEDGVDLKSFSADTIEFCRKMLLKKVNPQLNAFTIEHDPALEKQIDALLHKVSVEKLKAMLEILIDASQSLKYAPIAQLPLELATVKIIEPVDELSQGSDTPSQNIETELQFEAPARAKPNPAAAKKTASKAVKKTVAPQPKVKAKPKAKNETGSVTLNQVLNQWEAVVALVKEVNHSLASTLRMHKPSEIHNERLTIPFKFKFHKERIDDNSNKDLLEKILSDHFGHPLQIDAVIVKDLEMAVPGEKENAVDAVLQNFGGKVIG